MATGNRIVNNYQDNIWLSVFYDAVGTYVNIINNELGSAYSLEPLSNYIRIGGGYAFKTVHYKKEGIPIIRISDFNNEKVVLDNCVYYNEDKALTKYELNANDIIICLTGGTIAKLGIVQEGLGKLYLNQRVGRFDIIDPSKFEKEYVYWIARSVQSIIKTLAWGAAIPNVSPKQIEQLKFTIPPVEIQRFIIAFLNDLKENTLKEGVYFDDKIEKQIILLHQANIKNKIISSEFTTQLSLVKQLRQAFLSEAMQGKLCQSEPIENSETGQQLLARINAEKAQLIKDKKSKKEKELPIIKTEEIPFKIPNNWTWCRLGGIVNLITSGSRDWAKYYSSKGSLFVTMGNLSRNSFKLRMDKLRYVIPPKNQEGDRTRLLENDILISITGEVGNLGLIPANFGEAYINQHTALVRLNNHIVARYICYLFVSTELQNQFNAPQRGMKNSFRLTDIENLLIPLPPPLVQAQVVAKLDQLMKACDDLDSSIKQSQIQNEQLLQQVLKEALEVKEKPAQNVKLAIPDNRKNFAKQVLGGKIISLFKDDPNFTHIKFQKLQYLSEHIAEADLGSNYYFQAAGPYDNKFMHSIAISLERSKWFKEENYRYYPLEKVDQIDQYYDGYFAPANEKLNNLFNLLANATEAFSEIIATLYAVWNNRIIRKEELTDELLIVDFYSWSDRKRKYSEDELKKGLEIIRANNIEPRGFGKQLKRAKGK